MKPLTTPYLPIFISSNEFNRKRSHFLPVSISATFAKKKPLDLLSPQAQSQLISESSTAPTPKKVIATGMINDTNSSSRIPKIMTHGQEIEPIAPLMLPIAFYNTFKEIINKFINSSMIHSSDDDRSEFVSGNFAPVDELSPTRCLIIHGSIPSCLLGGAYIRNGPNPAFLPRGPHHLYDGDGMLHSLLFSEDEGTATLCSRYVQTYKYCLERDVGYPVMIKIFSDTRGFAGVASRITMIARALTGQMNLTKGFGMANTSVAFFGGCLYALGEPDLPYSVQVDPVTGEISTIGRCDFEGSLAMGMTAHPKKDPVTGETFAFRWMPVPPFLTYFHFDTAGNKSADVPIFSVQQPSFIHDFAITKNYVVFNDLQLVMNLMATLSGSGAPVGFHGGKVPRLGILPRSATNDSKIRWFDVPGFNMLHSLNAWEEEGANGENLLVLVGTNMLGVEHMPDHLELVHSCVEMIRINLDTRVVSRTPLSVGNLEFGVINTSYVGRQNRYAYLAARDNHLLKLSGVVKLDFSLTGTGDCIVASRDFGSRCFGGEPFFVPNDGSEEEDDGYLLSYVHNEETAESSLVIMDARSAKLEIVSEVVLPHRVPFGLHGLFVSKAELLSQHHHTGKF